MPSTQTRTPLKPARPKVALERRRPSAAPGTSRHVHVLFTNACRRVAQSLRLRSVLRDPVLFDRAVLRAVSRVEGASAIAVERTDSKRSKALQLLVGREFVKALARIQREAVRHALATVAGRARRMIAVQISLCVMPRSATGDELLRCMDPRVWRVSASLVKSPMRERVLIGLASRYLKAQDRGAVAARDSVEREREAAALGDLLARTLGGR
ncbi:MAG: hypothetical protein U1E76_07290 [Planctomycetota bacterium]